MSETNIIDSRKATSHPFNYEKHAERLALNNGDYTIAFFSDTHLGYGSYTRTDERGVNLREVDGDRALMEIAKSIVADPTIVAVVHGGDIFHYSHPKSRLVKLVLHVLQMFASEGIKFYGQAGNHDYPDIKRDITAVSLLDDPSRHSYALWKPYQVYRISDDIYLHSVAHHGLAADEAPNVQAVQGAVNLFSTHGAALDPKNHTLMSCEGSVREQIIPNELVIDEDFAAKLLGHYHQRYAVGGGMFNTWYAGSTVRRGFSDGEGARGWMRVTVHPSGKVDIKNENINQRPQYDLGIIDASGLNASEVQEMIEANIANIPQDIQSGFDLRNAPIVRQKVINASRSTKAGIDRRRIVGLTQNMLSWDLSITQPEITDTMNADSEHDHAHTEDGASVSLTNERGSGGAAESFDHWIDRSSTLTRVPERTKKKVTKDAKRHLENAEQQRGQ